MIREIQTVQYETVDGQKFATRAQAEDHQKRLREVRAFLILCEPDLTEGCHGPRPKGRLLVQAKGQHDLFAEDWCFRTYGRPVEFVQGVYGSNAIMRNWEVQAIPLSDEMQLDVLDRICEQFVTPLPDFHTMKLY